MCDWGITATVVSVVATAVSTALSVTSAVNQANAAEAQYEYQAEQDRRNADTAEKNATEARQAGIEESRLKRMKTLAQIGELKTANAANGVNINSGTALDTIEDTATMGELDALNSLYQSERTAQNYEIQAGNLVNQSGMNSISAKNASKAGALNAFGTALEGIGKSSQKFAGKWYGFNINNNNSDFIDKPIKMSYSGGMA